MTVGLGQWRVHRLRDVAELRVSNVDKHEKEGEIPVRLCNYVDVYKRSRITDRIEFMRATATAEEVERFRLRRGDVLITKDSETWTDIAVPALVDYEAPDLISGYHLALLRPRPCLMNGGFLYRALQSADVAHQFHVAATGVTRYGLSHAAIKSVVIDVPPLADQAAIARFLDHADRRIRRAISTKQKLIALLNEQKQAVVHRTVTRGLDPDVRLKPSGVAWLGDVPEGWHVRRLGQICRSFRTGPFGSALHQSDYVEGGIPIVNPTHMRDGSVVEDSRRAVSPETADRLSGYRIQTGDVLFARRGELGRCALVRERENTWLCGTGSIRVRPLHEEVLPEYLIRALQLQFVGEYLSLSSVGATMDNLNTAILKSLPLLIPPREEQQQLLDHLNDATRSLAQAAELATTEVGLLREFRTRLIADVVTGKSDVREAAERLSDELGEPEPVDDVDLAEVEEPGAEDLEAVEA